jgi:hypothetical protein
MQSAALAAVPAPSALSQATLRAADVLPGVAADVEGQTLIGQSPNAESDNDDRVACVCEWLRGDCESVCAEDMPRGWGGGVYPWLSDALPKSIGWRQPYSESQL